MKRLYATVRQITGAPLRFYGYVMEGNRVLRSCCTRRGRPTMHKGIVRAQRCADRALGVELRKRGIEETEL